MCLDGLIFSMSPLPGDNGDDRATSAAPTMMGTGSACSPGQSDTPLLEGGEIEERKRKGV